MTILSSHIPFGRLVDLTEGRLPPSEQARVQQHLASCPRCSADLEWLEHTIGLMRTDDSEDAPYPVIARAVRLFGPLARQTTATPRRRVAAVLHFDSAQLPLAAGVRGDLGPRQLLFGVEELELDVRIRPTGEAWAVSGQVLGPGAAGQVKLWSETVSAQVPLGDLSEFTFPPVPAGSYVLLLSLADVDVLVDRLELGE